MGVEIERKFLVRHEEWRSAVQQKVLFRQGYLVGSEHASVRVRIEGEQANINIKSATLGISRQEYEYEIPLEDAQMILDQLCEKPFIEKYRHIIHDGSHQWEIDEFLGDNAGLVVAEIELGDACELFSKPDWLGSEVSDDPRYYNVCLVKHPYKEWDESPS